MGERAILHCDCNAFFASVECLDHPAYWDVPMAVAGDPKERSGIILAKNELAKRCGVQTAETIWQARTKCPQLLLVPPHLSRYTEISKRINELYGQYTDQVEPFSIDESYLDVTGSLRYFRATAPELADELRARVRTEIGITISAGVSFNKFFAKIGSDMKKPDATTVITRENYRDKVWPLPIRDMLYVGRSSAQALERRCIDTIGALARLPRDTAERMLGKCGAALWDNANGLDESPVLRPGEREPIKSVSNGMTFRRDLLAEDEIRAGLIALCDEVASRLRAAGQKCRTVQVAVKNPQLQAICRQYALPCATHLQRELAQAAMGLVRANWSIGPDGRCAPIRALTVAGMNLIPDGDAQEQLSLLPPLGGSMPDREQLERVEAAMARIRERHGVYAIAMGCAESDELGIYRLRGRGPVWSVGKLSVEEGREAQWQAQ